MGGQYLSARDSVFLDALITAFLHGSRTAHRDLKMSWDRVIQDSDEDEPFIEDEGPTSIAPVQDQEPPPNHEPRDHPADQHTATQVSEQVYAPEYQLSVDFDQYLQSQDMSHASITASQQKREEMWIPPTGDGGESIGTLVHSYVPIATRREPIIHLGGRVFQTYAHRHRGNDDRNWSSAAKTIRR